jgi:superfamily I DNA/RNA helicase
MIFQAIREVVDVDMELHPRCPEGIAVKRHLQKSRRKTLETIEGLLSKYIKEEQIRPEQITILTPHTKANSLLAGIEQMADCPIAQDPSDRRGAILHTTIGKFKGLESDVVICADIDPEDERCNLNARYVAMSRARQVLHEFWKREW